MKSALVSSNTQQKYLGISRGQILVATIKERAASVVLVRLAGHSRAAATRQVSLEDANLQLASENRVVWTSCAQDVDDRITPIEHSLYIYTWLMFSSRVEASQAGRKRGP